MFVAREPQQLAGRVIGSGHCVPFVRHAAGAPETAAWRRGPRPGADEPPGTAIATFTAAGRYANTIDGDSHAAILVAAHADGSLTVWDQWLGQPVHQRIIRDRGGTGSAANDASRFHVILASRELG